MTEYSDKELLDFALKKLNTTRDSISEELDDYIYQEKIRIDLINKFRDFFDDEREIDTSFDFMDDLIAHVNSTHCTKEWWQKLAKKLFVDSNVRNLYIQKLVPEFLSSKGRLYSSAPRPFSRLAKLARVNLNDDESIVSVRNAIRINIMAACDSKETQEVVHMIYFLHAISYSMQEGEDTSKILLRVLDLADVSSTDDLESIAISVATFLYAYPNFILKDVRRRIKNVKGIHKLGRKNRQVAEML